MIAGNSTVDGGVGGLPSAVKTAFLFCSIYGMAESRPLNHPNQQSWPGTPEHYIRTCGANWLPRVQRKKRVLHFIQDDTPQKRFALRANAQVPEGPGAPGFVA